MKNYFTVLLLALAFIGSTGRADGTNDPKTGHPDVKAAFADCSKSSGVEPGKQPTEAQHLKFRECMATKGITLPKPDPAREAAFKECMKTAAVVEGKVPTKEQFTKVHDCMDSKGFKSPPHFSKMPGPGGPMMPPDMGKPPHGDKTSGALAAPADGGADTPKK